MVVPEILQSLYIVSAFLFQLILVVYFALRKWRFETAIRYGWLVYALGIPAAGASVVLWLGGETWALWLGGLIYLIWAIFGYVVEYGQKIEWRIPVRWPIFVPYVALYLATVMFYWFPLALITKPLWYGCAVLFVLSTVLNVTSHGRPATSGAC